ncbi:uridine kinase [uncultured Legionella sp.]|uniref:uridine kinase n=1 Tax=uncultured Legionella sp. TaxID=210934 RepID=UPI00261C5B03|nr:uridine kinase [uncultured Legionella sp.]
MLIIGVAGCSGSGKTTVSKGLEKHFGDDCAVISADSYYRGIENIPDSNFDDPAAIEFELLIEHLTALKRGETVKVPVYDFKTHSRTEEFVEVSPQKVIIVEGILVLHPEKLMTLFDKAVFVDADIRVCRDRRTARDIVERGRTQESALKQWEQVEACYLQYVEPSKKNAHILVENTTANPSLEFDIAPLIDELTQQEHKPNRYKLFSLTYLKSQKETVLPVIDEPQNTDEPHESNESSFVIQ